MFIFELCLYTRRKYIIQNLFGNILLRTLNLNIKHIRNRLKCDHHIGIKMDLLYDNIYQIVFIDFAILFPDAFEYGIIGDKSIDLNDELDINDNIPQTIMYLPNLRNLSFECKSIPSFIFDMIDLRSLQIGRELYELSSDINKLINLKKLIIVRNSLDILPILTLPKLTCLTICQSSLISLNLSSLSLLTQLNLSNNKLTILPDLNHLNYLTTLKLDSNYLEEFTDVSLPLLTRLKLHDNQLREFKNNNFPQLISLRLTDNWLDKFDSNSLPNLSTLYLDNNGFVYLDLKNVPKLSHLDVSINEIAEIINIPLGIYSIDAEENKLTDLFNNGLQSNSLLRLNISDNYISNIGEIDCPNLDNLCLSYNKLTKLPIVTNSKLKYLDICNNIITGEIDIPTTLVKFNAHDNMITKINNIGTCTFMEELSLTNNNISGDIDIPITLLNFDACNNYITKINNIYECSSLKTLKLDHNKFTEVPNFPWFSRLKELSISHNNISGNLSFPRGIIELKLSHNNISDASNMIDGGYDDLKSLDLSYNNISEISNIHSTNKLNMLNLTCNPITYSKITKKTHNRVRTIYCKYNADSSDCDEGSESDYGDGDCDYGW